MAFPENTVNDTGIKHIWDKVTAALSGKVDKVSGKGLSTNDYTTAEKDKLAGIESGAQVNPTIDSALSGTSTNAVQNKVVKSALDGKANTGDIPTVNNKTITIQLNGTTIESFTLNQSSNETINIQVTKSDVGLNNVGNFKAVSTVADQGLTSTEKSNARANIGAGTSNFDGAYSSLSGKPTLGTASAKDIPSSGNASTSQVVMGNDTRLSDSRPASDVSSWAKASTKPTYTASEVGLGNVPNVSTNDQTPTFTEASTRANIASGEKLSVILGKIKKFFTDLKTVAFTGAYSDLTGKPTIPAAQVNSDWNASSGVAQILNKPTIPAAANNGTLTIQKNGTNVQTFSANQSSNVTANIAVPTKVSELTNDSGYITSNLITGVKGDSESSYRTGNVNITKTNIGLGNVGNFKAVSTVASQGLTSTEKSNARTNIGAGTSSLTINQVTSETDTRYVAKNSDIDLDGHELDLGTNGGIAWGTDSAKTTTYPTTIMSADSSLDALFPTSGAVKSYINSNMIKTLWTGSVNTSGTTNLTSSAANYNFLIVSFNTVNSSYGCTIVTKGSNYQLQTIAGDDTYKLTIYQRSINISNTNFTTGTGCYMRGNAYGTGNYLTITGIYGIISKTI